jgi:hypothetical protein
MLPNVFNTDKIGYKSTTGELLDFYWWRMLKVMPAAAEVMLNCLKMMNHQ